MDDQPIRLQLVRLLEGDDAHMRFEEAVADFPADAINAFPPNVPYTPWHLVEHLRITQRDILDYIVDPAYQEPTVAIGLLAGARRHRNLRPVRRQRRRLPGRSGRAP